MVVVGISYGSSRIRSGEWVGRRDRIVLGEKGEREVNRVSIGEVGVMGARCEREVRSYSRSGG